VTNDSSAKMASGKGVIRGYSAQAAVDARHQVNAAADVTGSERAMLLPMIEQVQPFATGQTVLHP
jgi:hypothetical protein